jgi:hypothetical protein
MPYLVTCEEAMIRYHGQPYEDSDDFANDVIAGKQRRDEQMEEISAATKRECDLLPSGPGRHYADKHYDRLSGPGGFVHSRKELAELIDEAITAERERCCEVIFNTCGNADLGRAITKAIKG